MKKKATRADLELEAQKLEALLANDMGSSKKLKSFKSKFKSGRPPRSTVAVDKVFDWMANPRTGEYYESEIEAMNTSDTDVTIAKQMLEHQQKEEKNKLLKMSQDGGFDYTSSDFFNNESLSDEEYRLASFAAIEKNKNSNKDDDILSDDEDEPLIAAVTPQASKRIKKNKKKKKESKLVASNVLNAHESEETLKILVENLETSDLEVAKADLERWERVQERRERVVTPKLPKLLPKLKSHGQSPSQSNIRFAPIVRTEKKTRNGIVEEWRVMTPLPLEVLQEQALKKTKKRRKGKNNGYLKMITKLRKQRRVDNYAAVYSLPMKETISPRSPREKVAEALRKLKQLEEARIRESNLFDSLTQRNEEMQMVEEGKQADPTVSLYRKAWLLQQQQQQQQKGRW